MRNLITDFATIVFPPDFAAERRDAAFDAVREEIEDFFDATLRRYESALARGDTDTTVIVQDPSEGKDLRGLLTQWWDGMRRAGRLDARNNLVPKAYL